MAFSGDLPQNNAPRTGPGGAAGTMGESTTLPTDWTAEDERYLRDAGWQQRDAAQTATFVKYWPDWTHPQFDPSIDISTDGLMQRPTRAKPAAFLRPAILDRDRRDGPSQYAKRFGIHPTRQRDAASSSRSRMTPISRTAPASSPVSDGWTEDESYQSFLLSGSTSEDYVVAGIHDPGCVVDEPDLASDIHDLFQRPRWTQDPIPRDSPAYSLVDGEIFTRIRYRLGGREGLYDAQDGHVWTALQPSLRIATKVLRSSPPAWLAFLNFTQSLRKVPRHVDGRTDAEKTDPDYRPYRSLWLRDESNWDTYESAGALNDLGFDSGKATMAVLKRDVRFSVMSSSVNGLAASYWDSDAGRVAHRICISADFVWPLLVTEYTASEKAVYQVLVARVIVHELCHTCRYAHNQMMFQPETIQAMPDREFDLSDAMAGHLRNLKDEVHGPGGDLRSRWFFQYFFRDEPQLEEGKSVDNQLWGGDIVFAPAMDMGLLNPILSLHRWPWAHVAVHLQNRASVEAGDYARFTTGGGYNTFLVNPPAPAYNFSTAIPIKAYEGFRRRAWWQAEFQRFGHHGLRLTSDISRRIQSPGTTPRFLSTLSHGSINESIADLLQVAYPDEDNAAVYFMEMAQALLVKQGYSILAKYLRGLVLETVLPEIEHRRLNYEESTWPRIYDQELCNLADKARRDFGELQPALNNLASTPPTARPHIQARSINERLHVLIQDDLLELHGRTTYHAVMYAQALVGIYFLQPRDRRALIRPHLFRLRQCLQRVRDRVERVRLDLTGWNPVIFRHQSGQALDLDRLPTIQGALRRLAQRDSLLSGSPGNGSSEMARTLDDITRLTETLANLRSMAPIIQSDVSKLDEILTLIADGNIESPQTTPESSAQLRYLSRAQRTIGGTRALRRAALLELSRATNTRLIRLIRTWLDILASRPHSESAVQNVRNAMILTELVWELRRDRRGETAIKLRRRIRDLAAGDQSVRDRLRREFSSQELAELGVTNRGY